jgi:hypothetical protein
MHSFRVSCYNAEAFDQFDFFIEIDRIAIAFHS